MKRICVVICTVLLLFGNCVGCSMIGDVKEAAEDEKKENKISEKEILQEVEDVVEKGYTKFLNGETVEALSLNSSDITEWCGDSGIEEFEETMYLIHYNEFTKELAKKFVKSSELNQEEEEEFMREIEEEMKKEEIGEDDMEVFRKLGVEDFKYDDYICLWIENVNWGSGFSDNVTESEKFIYNLMQGSIFYTGEYNHLLKSEFGKEKNKQCQIQLKLNGNIKTKELSVSASFIEQDDLMQFFHQTSKIEKYFGSSKEAMDKKTLDETCKIVESCIYEKKKLDMLAMYY